jgi:hypothetical protein
MNPELVKLQRYPDLVGKGKIEVLRLRSITQRRVVDFDFLHGPLQGLDRERVLGDHNNPHDPAGATTKHENIVNWVQTFCFLFPSSSLGTRGKTWHNNQSTLLVNFLFSYKGMVSCRGTGAPQRDIRRSFAAAASIQAIGDRVL